MVNFDSLYREYNGQLVGWLTKKCGNRANAEDAAQSAWCKLVAKEDILSDTVKSLLYLTAQRVMVDQWRRKNGECGIPQELEIGFTFDDANPAEYTEDSQLLTLIGLRQQGYKLAEIADKMGLNISTVKRLNVQAAQAILAS